MEREAIFLLPVLFGFGLDLLLGDPAVLTSVHPVSLMGRCICRLERLLRGVFPKTRRGERVAGFVLAVLLPVGTLVLSGMILWLLDRLCPPAGVLVRTLWCWQVLAIRNLRDESGTVYKALAENDLPLARRRVSRIVGRDTDALSKAGVIRAAVETVAESFADGVTAPMLYLFLGGPPLALAYKAINTMDSMVGYRNQQYLWFGRAAARLDDLAGFFPARLAALLLILSAGAVHRRRQAFAIWRRDRLCHESPNAGQCEAAMAGALGVQLGGGAAYFGVWRDKPFLGDDTRAPRPEDILLAGKLMLLSSVVCFGLLLLLRLAAVILAG